MQMRDFGLPGEYQWLPQPEALEKLAMAGVNITSQTLRNWERNSLIIPAARSGRRGGRISKYCEFSLAEAFAVYTLNQGTMPLEIGEETILLPKFSLQQLSLARQQMHRAGCQILHYPAPPSDDDVGIYYPKSENDETGFRKNLPLPEFKLPPIHTVHQPGDPQFDNGHISLRNCFFQTLYMAWFCALSSGCDKFLDRYKEFQK